MKNITIADVAAHAKVSKSTVSQYLNKRYDYMGESTKQRIEDAISTLGYHPNIVARSLKQKSTKTIGVIVASILHNFTTEVTRAIEDACISEGYHTIICNADNNPDKEKKYIDMLRAKQVDGLIIFPTGGNKELYQKMIEQKYPVVFLDRFMDGLPISSILLDNEKAMMMAVGHLVKQDYKKIGLVTMSIKNEITPRIERINGYKKALRLYKITETDTYIRSTEPSRIQEAIRELMSLDEPPEALIAGNDLVLYEILTYIKKNNIALPEDLALIGIDDVKYASIYTPSITTIAQPTFEMGKKSAELLLGKITKTEVEQESFNYRYEPTLYVRESVKVLKN